MGVLGRVLAGDMSVPFSPASYDAVFPTGWAAGVEVTPEAAMSLATVYACTTVISESIATSPLHMYEMLGEDAKRSAPGHPLEELLHDQPNQYQTAVEFREMMTAFAILRGKGIAEIESGRRGPVNSLRPLHPDLIVTEITTSGKLRYQYQDPIAKRRRTLLPEDVFVLRGRYGRSVLSYAADAFGLQLSMRRHSTEMYQRGMRHAGVLQHPKTLSEKARANLRRGLDEYRIGGERSGRPLLLEEGMTWQNVTLTQKDAEYVLTRQADRAETASWFRVPPHKIGDLSEATFSNIEKQAIEYVTDCLVPWAERWEQVIRRDLIVAQGRYFAEHNLDGLLRGDIKTRYEAYAIGRQWGWLSTNDIRRKENLNPIADGDADYLVPLNMTTDKGQLAFAPPLSVEAKGYLRVMVRDAAARLVRKESAALAKLRGQTGGEGDAWREGVRGFFREHAEFVGKVLRVTDDVAEGYAATRCHAILEATDEDELATIGRLTDLALGESPVLQLTTSDEPAAAAAPAPVHVTVSAPPVPALAPEQTGEAIRELAAELRAERESRLATRTEQRLEYDEHDRITRVTEGLVQ